ncbi:hypothetical protein DACRYDRAFT_100720, partial [Dacryopinax primogenitus]
MPLLPAFRSFRPKTNWMPSFCVGPNQKPTRQLPHFRDLESDIIPSIPDSEDTDDGMTHFLLEARRNSTEHQASSDKQVSDAVSTLSHSRASIASSTIAKPSSSKDGQSIDRNPFPTMPNAEWKPIARGNSAFATSIDLTGMSYPHAGNLDVSRVSSLTPAVSRSKFDQHSRVSFRSMTTSARSDATTTSTSKTAVSDHGSSTTDRSKARRRATVPKKNENFELPLKEYAVWIQDHYDPLVHGQPFPCQALQNETVFLAVSDVGKHSVERERLIVVRRLGGNVTDKYGPDVTMIATTKSAVDNRSAAKAVGLSRLTNVPADVKIVLWDYMVDCQQADGPEIPRSTMHPILHQDRKPIEKKAKPSKSQPTSSEPNRNLTCARSRDNASSDLEETPKKHDVKQLKLSKLHKGQLTLLPSDEDESEPIESLSQPVKDPLEDLYDEAAAQLVQEGDSLDISDQSMDESPVAGTSQLDLDKAPAKGFACLEK